MPSFPAILLLVFASQCCAELKVFPSKTTDVAQYSTYTWLAPRVFTSTGMQENDPVYAPLIRQAINRELVRKGYQEMEQGGQLQVVAAAVGSKSSQLEAYLVAFFGLDVFGGGLGPVVATPMTRITREGALAISLFDPQSKVAVWSAYITQSLGKPGDDGKKIDSAATKLLKKLPRKIRQ